MTERLLDNILLQKAFVRKAREVFAQFSVEQSQKYEYVKDVILHGYPLNSEAYQQKFRNIQRNNNQTFVELVISKLSSCLTTGVIQRK